MGKVICHKNDSILEVFSYGFVFHLAIVQVIAIPCLLLKVSFDLFLSIYLFIMMGLFLYYFLFRKPSFSSLNLKSITDRIKNGITLWICFATIIIVFQIIYSSYMMHTDADDGHMTTVSTVAIKENRLDISFYDVYDGIYTGRMRESIYSWELFIAILSKLFRIHPAIVDHSVIIAPLLVLSYIAVFNVIKLVLKGRKKQQCALFLYSLLILFAGYSRHSRGCFMLLRIWQGKAVLASFLLFMILHSCLRIYKGDYSWRRWIINLCIVIAGTGSSVIGIYMLPIAYIVYGLPLAIYLLTKWNIKQLLLIFRRLIITILPVVIMGGVVLFGIMSGNWGGDVIPTGQTEPDWKYTFVTIFEDSYMIYLLVASAFVLVADFVIRWNKQKKETNLVVIVEDKLRIMLVVFSVVLFVTFLNPFFCDFISRYVTGIIVYWRLYWILPMDLVIAVAVTLVIGRIKIRPVKCAIAIVSVIFVAISGRYMFSKDLFFEPHENYYKIPNEVLTVSDYLLSKDNDPVSIFPEGISYYPRQYDSHIKVIGARGFSTNQNKIADSDMTYSWLYNSIYNDKKLNDENVRYALSKLGVEYIYMDYAATLGTPLDGEVFDDKYYEINEVYGCGYVYSLK